MGRMGGLDDMVRTPQSSQEVLIMWINRHSLSLFCESNFSKEPDLEVRQGVAFLTFLMGHTLAALSSL